jgi:N6-adenosine-specific RNA methylase IME4
MLGEATLDVSGTFAGEAIRLLILFAAPQMGYHTRGNPELCLLAARGTGVQRLRRDVRELIIAPRRQHSQKPDEAYERIERLWPGPYLELFARNRRPGWQGMGNEADSGPITQRRWPSNSYPAQASLD